MNGGATDHFKDVATKSLSGLESLVDQIPNLNEQEAGLGTLTHTVTPHNGEFSVFRMSQPECLRYPVVCVPLRFESLILTLI